MLVKKHTPAHKKIKLVIDLLEKLNLRVEFLAGEIRVTDCDEDSEIYHNLALIDEDGDPISQLPPLSEDYRLQVFE